MGKLRQILFACVGLAAMVPGTPAAAADQASVTVSDAWVREAGSVQMNTAAFMTIRNTSTADVAIVSVRTPAAKVAELHEMRDDGGVMRMRKVDRLVVPAQGTLTLKPGGLHVMLFQLTAPLKAGATVALEFQTADGASLTVSAPVRSLQ